MKLRPSPGGEGSISDAGDQGSGLNAMMFSKRQRGGVFVGLEEGGGGVVGFYL